MLWVILKKYEIDTHLKRLGFLRDWLKTEAASRTIG